MSSLPKREELMVEIAELKATKGKNPRKRKELEGVLERVEELHEFNPMLGHRGCRLGITFPEITKMQAQAIFEAAVQCAKKGIKVIPEVMIPLVGNVRRACQPKEDRRRDGRRGLREKGPQGRSTWSAR